MEKEIKIQILLLKIRDAIANKEWLIADSNHDVSKFGEWQWDKNSEMQQAQAEVNNLFLELEEMGRE